MESFKLAISSDDLPTSDGFCPLIRQLDSPSLDPYLPGLPTHYLEPVDFVVPIWSCSNHLPAAGSITIQTSTSGLLPNGRCRATCPGHLSQTEEQLVPMVPQDERPASLGAAGGFFCIIRKASRQDPILLPSFFYRASFRDEGKYLLAAVLRSPS